MPKETRGRVIRVKIVRQSPTRNRRPRGRNRDEDQPTWAYLVLFPLVYLIMLALFLLFRYYFWLVDNFSLREFPFFTIFFHFKLSYLFLSCFFLLTCRFIIFKMILKIFRLLFEIVSTCRSIAWPRAANVSTGSFCSLSSDFVTAAGFISSVWVLWASLTYLHQSLIWLIEVIIRCPTLLL